MKNAKPAKTKPPREPGRPSKVRAAPARKGMGPVTQSDFSVVGIGASAGGLEALEQFFGNVKERPGMAFIVVPHLDPSHHSLMTELLRRITTLDVTEAMEGLQVQPDHVY